MVMMVLGRLDDVVVVMRVMMVRREVVVGQPEGDGVDWEDAIVFIVNVELLCGKS